jgi:hypothetical protein
MSDDVHVRNEIAFDHTMPFSTVNHSKQQLT